MTSTPARSLPAWATTLTSLVTANLKENKDLISYAFATFDPATNKPRVRYVVHRGLVNERRKDGDGSSNDVKDSEGNEYVSDKLVVTTDVRSPKARQLLTSPTVELAWWLSATQHQFRIAGQAYILPPPSSSSPSSSASSLPSFPFPSSTLSPYPSFNWEQERLRQFRKLSPELRASFFRPVPGSKLSEFEGKMEDLPEKLPESEEVAETEEEKSQIRAALKNFALIVIDPTEVDLINLAAVPNTRIQWRFDTTKNSWNEEALVP